MKKGIFKLMGLAAMSLVMTVTAASVNAYADDVNYIDWSDYRCGDINVDGKVDLTDAVLSLKLALGIIKDGDEGVCAKNGMIEPASKIDVTCTLTDTTLVLKMALGIPAYIKGIPDIDGNYHYTEVFPYSETTEEAKKQYDVIDSQVVYAHDIEWLPGSSIGLSEDEYMSYDDFNEYAREYYNYDGFVANSAEITENALHEIYPDFTFHVVYGEEDKVSDEWLEKITLEEQGKCRVFGPGLTGQPIFKPDGELMQDTWVWYFVYAE